MGNWFDGFSGRTAIVSGSSEGIGSVLAKALIDSGANVLLVARREDLLQQTARSLGSNAAWISADLAKVDTADRVVEKAISIFGRIDFLINNAGLNRPGFLHEMQAADLTQMAALNLIAPSLLTQAAVPYLAKNEGAAILNISTIGSRKATAGNGFYSATKAGLNYLTSVWAVELADQGIRVNTIAPGGTDTPQFAKVADEIEGYRDMVAGMHLIKRIALPEELVAPSMLLLSPISGRNITGALIDAGGGYHLT